VRRGIENTEVSTFLLLINCTFLSILLTIRWYFMDKDNVVC